MIRKVVLVGILLLLAVQFDARNGGFQDHWVATSPHQSAFIKVNGAKLHYLDWGGKEQALLFLTGLGNSAHIFDDIAPKFIDGFRVLGLTRRGHGKSDHPKHGYDPKTLVEDIRQFLDALTIARVSLVGHSMAGDEMTLFAGAPRASREACLSRRRL